MDKLEEQHSASQDGNGQATVVRELLEAPIGLMAEGASYRRFTDADIDGCQEVRRTDFDRCEWRNVRMKEVRFYEAAVTRCRLVDVYLPSARFVRCDLTGTTFSRCDLRHAEFEDCKMWYVRFFGCELDYDQLVKNAPSEVNLRRKFLHSLRLNALSRREHKDANRLLMLEMEAERQENSNILLAVDEYFQRNFSLRERFQALGKLAILTVEKLIWGYGAKLSALFRSAVLLVLFFAVLVWLTGAMYVMPGTSAVAATSFWEACYVSAVSFTTLGGPVPANALSKLYSVVQSGLGAVFLGLFAAAVLRRLER